MQAATNQCVYPLSIHVEDLSLTYLTPATSLPPPFDRCTGKPFLSKAVLSCVNMHVRSGQVLALMGCSGSGKTTLLNMLAARQFGGKVGGHIKFTHRTHHRKPHTSVSASASSAAAAAAVYRDMIITDKSII